MLNLPFYPAKYGISVFIGVFFDFPSKMVMKSALKDLRMEEAQERGTAWVAASNGFVVANPLVFLWAVNGHRNS